MRVFVDASVLFSASLHPHGNAPRLIDISRVGGCVLLTSALAVLEAERNLGRKAPRALTHLTDVVASLEVVAGAPPPEVVQWAASLGLPAQDAPILAAAVVTRADLLVTSDRRHFGSFFGHTLHGVRIMSLAEGLATALEAAEGGAA